MIYNNKFIDPRVSNFVIDMLKNPDTLNIFSDASMRTRSKNNKILDSCYGSVAVNIDTIIDELFRVASNSTVPAAEIRGLRCSLTLALKYRYNYKIINIFSDSQVALFGLRDYIYGWRYAPDGNLYNKSATVVKNQELFIECFQLLGELRKTNIVNLYHQPGHIQNGLDSLKDGITVFKKSNNIRGIVDYNTIRYISLYNNYVDNKSRSFIRSINIYENTFIDPLIFYPKPDIFSNTMV